jgi:hypothetical protein
MPNTPRPNNPQLSLPQRRINSHILPSTNTNRPQRQPSLRIKHIHPIACTSEDPPIPRGPDTIVDERDRNADQPGTTRQRAWVRHIICFKSTGAVRVLSVAFIRGYGPRIGDVYGAFAIVAFGEGNAVGLICCDVKWPWTESSPVDEIDG